MKESVPSPFSATPVEDEVYLGMEKLCEELGIVRFHLVYVQNDENGTSTWKATTNMIDEDMAEKLQEASEAMRDTDDEYEAP